MRALAVINQAKFSDLQGSFVKSFGILLLHVIAILS